MDDGNSWQWSPLQMHGFFDRPAIDDKCLWSCLFVQYATRIISKIPNEQLHELANLFCFLNLLVTNCAACKHVESSWVCYVTLQNNHCTSIPFYGALQVIGCNHVHHNIPKYLCMLILNISWVLYIARDVIVCVSTLTTNWLLYTAMVLAMKEHENSHLGSSPRLIS